MEIQLIKQTDEKLLPEHAAIVRAYLLGAIDGATDADKRAWRLFLSALASAGSGEVFNLDVTYSRQAWFHKLHFKIIGAFFESQQSFDKLDQFRNWLKIGAGFVNWVDDTPIPKSISYTECSELEMREFHGKCVEFLRTQHAQSFLWPAVTPKIAEQCVESLLLPFEEF